MACATPKPAAATLARAPLQQPPNPTPQHCTHLDAPATLAPRARLPPLPPPAAAPAPAAVDEIPWHAVPSPEEVVEELASSAAAGLAPLEAARRLAEFGPNALTASERPGFLRKLWAQINSTVIWILFAAAIVKGAMKRCGGGRRGRRTRALS